MPVTSGVINQLVVRQLMMHLKHKKLNLSERNCFRFQTAPEQCSFLPAISVICCESLPFHSSVLESFSCKSFDVDGMGMGMGFWDGLIHQCLSVRDVCDREVPISGQSKQTSCPAAASPRPVSQCLFMKWSLTPKLWLPLTGSLWFSNPHKLYLVTP